MNLEIASDRDKIVSQYIPLLWTMLDLLSTEQWLKPVLIFFQLCQMVTQALWDTDSPLMQFPHMTREIAKGMKEKGINPLELEIILLFI